MTRYAERTSCRWAVIQAYFAVEGEARCGHCDVCVLDEAALVAGAVASLGLLMP